VRVARLDEDAAPAASAADQLSLLR
jgi:hypothetical protein